MSILRSDSIKNRAGTGAPDFPNGATVTGVVTATTFKGGAEITSGTIAATSGTFSGNVSVGGVLSYEDVTNIDSVGIITATKGIDITAGTSNLYQTDGSLSYYAANNAVYLNGAGASGWLRLQAAGSANDRTAINVVGHSATNGDEIYFKTNSTPRLRITSDGSVNIGGDYNQTSKKFKVTGNSTIDGGLLVTGLLEGGSGFSVVSGNLTLPAYTYHDGDADTYYGFSGANQFSVFTAGSERLKIDGNGVVKITRRLELTNSGDNHYVHQGRAWAWSSNGTSTGTVSYTHLTLPTKRIV